MARKPRTSTAGVRFVLSDTNMACNVSNHKLPNTSHLVQIIDINFRRTSSPREVQSQETSKESARGRSEVKSESTACLHPSLQTNIALQLSCHIIFTPPPPPPPYTRSGRRRHSCIRKSARIMSSSDDEPQDSNKDLTSPLVHGVSGPDYVAAMKVALATDPALQAKVRPESTSLPAHLYRPQSNRSHKNRTAS
jgi:hypothetical protein